MSYQQQIVGGGGTFLLTRPADESLVTDEYNVRDYIPSRHFAENNIR